jgi:hypothetical protein
MIKILLLLVLVVVIFFMFDLKENFDVTGNIFTQKSNEAIQNIAKIYADASGTVIFNNVNATGMINGDVTGNVTGNVTGDVTGNVTGNLTGNANINTLSSDVSNNPINVLSPLLLNKDFRPIIMSIAIGSTNVPITDLSGNTFAADKYICEVIGTGKLFAVTNVHNGVWWINTPEDGRWTQHLIKITPIEHYNVISTIKTGTMVSDGNSAVVNANKWFYGNYRDNGYYVVDSNNVAQKIIPKRV